MDDPARSEYDLIGVGFGPSNLSLAVAVEERNRLLAAAGGTAIRPRFFERRDTFAWHPGMLLESATVQVSFLKDLVTLRNPASDFSFVAYLHARGRLVDFVNHKTLFPLRVEFNDYFAWAAGRLAHWVAYSREVAEILPVVDGGVVNAFEVVVRHPTLRRQSYRARNVVIAAGLVPRLPEGVALGDRVWHNFNLLERLRALSATSVAPRRFVVVGAGQSAAEITEYLSQHYPDAEVCAVFSRFGYAPTDDSSFANRIFDPAAVDTFYRAPEAVKELLWGYHRNANYSVVDAELIDALYRRAYADKVLGRQRLRVHHASRLVGLEEGPDAVVATVEFLPDGRLTRLEADVVIYATGYRPSDPREVLGRMARLCARDQAGRLRVGRDHRLDLTVPSRAGLFATGISEHAHGISSTLLSNVAVRAGELLETIEAGPGVPAPGDQSAGAFAALVGEPQ